MKIRLRSAVILSSPLWFAVAWLLLLFGGCPAASGATTTATSSYRIQLVNGDVASKWCKVGDSVHGFTQIMLEPGQSAEMQFPRPSDGAIQVYNPASGWAGHVINAGDTLLLTWSYAEGLNAHFSPAIAPPVAVETFEIPESIEVPGLGEVELPEWAAENAELAFFFFGFAAAAGIRLVRACLRWFHRADATDIT